MVIGSESRYGAIHFDMDGVLVDTEALHVQAEQQTCREMGISLDETMWDGFKGRTAPDIFGHIIGEYGNPAAHAVEQLVQHKTDVFLELAQKQLRPIMGAMEFVEWARKHHPRMSLVTSSNRRVQSFVVKKLGIEDMFDAVVTGDDVQMGKPSPEPYMAAMQKLGVTAAESVVVEDSLSGIRSAHAAGCAVLALTTSHGARELLQEKPRHITHSFALAPMLLG